jgi:S1-C subfamily serine protease
MVVDWQERNSKGPPRITGERWSPLGGKPRRKRRRPAGRSGQFWGRLILGIAAGLTLVAGATLAAVLLWPGQEEEPAAQSSASPKTVAVQQRSPPPTAQAPAPRSMDPRPGARSPNPSEPDEMGPRKEPGYPPPPGNSERRPQPSAPGGDRLRRLSSGTGFVVAPGGFILTNQHVVRGPGQVFVHPPDTKDLIRAEIIAEDADRDIALLQIKVPDQASLKPLAVAGKRKVRRGEQVSVFGYPLGVSLGLGIKLNTGVVSATPERLNGDMFMLDAKVNPGNSGGPVCDPYGTVVGMVTAKSFSGEMVDSYGMAIPAPELDAFLNKTLDDYEPAEEGTKKMDWDEVDRKVSPSVVLILNRH